MARFLGQTRARIVARPLNVFTVTSKPPPSTQNIYRFAAGIRVETLSPRHHVSPQFPTPLLTFLAAGEPLPPPAAMWGRMWSSGRGSGSRSGRERDPERERRVRSDGARKRGARKWTNRGLSPPASFRVRETEEYDRRHGRTPSSAASFSP